MEAAIRWVEEAQHKCTLQEDKARLRWLDKHLKPYLLKDITRDQIEQIAKMKEQTGVSPATVNRLLALIRSILRKAEREWEWIDKAPMVRLRKERNQRVRWLTSNEARKLLMALPPHLRDMAAFSLATGLRESNVTGLQWLDVDLVNSHAWVHPDQAKARKAIAVPLNSDAMQILQNQKGKHDDFVFTFRDTPVTRCNTKAWRKALKRAGISQFRWHDLRHTWASWHVQNGTSLQELQQLGGWASYQMVLRYAHLSSEHLKEAAQRISGTNLVHSFM